MSNRWKYIIFLLKMCFFYATCIFLMYWLYNWNMLYTIKVALLLDRVWWYLYNHIRIEVIGFEDVFFSEFDVIKYIVYFIISIFFICRLIYWWKKNK